MAVPHFYLKDKTSNEPTLISLYYYIENKRFVFSTSEKIKPSLWSFKKERVNDRYGDSERINKKLDRLAKGILEIEDRLINEKGFATAKSVRDELKIFSGKKRSNKTLFNFIESFIEERKALNSYSYSSIKVYNNTRNHLHKFAKNAGHKEFDFADINYKFFKDWTKYLTDQNFSNNYIHKIISTFRTFLHEAKREGLKTNVEFSDIPITVNKETSDEIYLNKSELEKLYHLELSENPRLEKVRDLFLIGAFTGLRHSDFTRITEKHIRISEGYKLIEIIAKKTGQKIIVPLHPYVETILNKYNGEAPTLSQQKMNAYLKELGEQCGFLDELVTKSITKGGKRNLENNKKHKWELLKTHTARRSFATNAFLDGWSTLSIMKITGHTTETSFMKYIKVSEEQNAVHVAKTQIFKLNPELATMSNGLQLLLNKANELELTEEQQKLLIDIKEKLKATSKTHLKIAR